jgi:Peptidase C39 family
MLRPFLLDLFAALLPPAVGAAAFFAGTALHRLPILVFRWIITLAVLVVTGLVVAYLASLHDWTGAVLHGVGGETNLACGAALLLLGVVWSRLKRSTSSGFLGAVAGIAVLILGLNSSGRLWWRWGAEAAWRNAPDRNGCLTQTSWMTCAPAAATMLLHHHGIAATEGELAYRSGTSLFGTDLYTTAAALTDKGREQGWSARVERFEYAEWVRRGSPFIAHTNIPSLGGHALFVEKAEAEGAWIVDPRFGRREKLPRDEFLRIWEGRAIALLGPEESGS